MNRRNEVEKGSSVNDSHLHLIVRYENSNLLILDHRCHIFEYICTAVIFQFINIISLKTTKISRPLIYPYHILKFYQFHLYLINANRFQGIETKTNRSLNKFHLL
ncbi:unnamed protein product [Litomosoides sigmodontis]|uniref:Uncharacterized protein n=1 Tax=Litomosoides sigmodontis TaxID=42156 RepID=A0A3P6UXA7_LITSI|nr:unnamed protein product [Litomosoides sigmodontis]